MHGAPADETARRGSSSLSFLCVPVVCLHVLACGASSILIGRAMPRRVVINGGDQAGDRLLTARLGDEQQQKAASTSCCTGKPGLPAGISGASLALDGTQVASWQVGR